MSSDKPVSAPIAAVRGGDRSAAEVLRAFALARKARGVRVGGIVAAAAADLPAGAAHDVRSILLDVSTGDLISIHQNLGSGSQSCSLDTAAMTRACVAVERAISEGVDLVVLNKFGGQEMERRGLLSAFQAAAAAGLPIACVVAPKAADAWEAFAADLAVWVPAELEALDAWWQDRTAAKRAAA